MYISNKTGQYYRLDDIFENIVLIVVLECAHVRYIGLNYRVEEGKTAGDLRGETLIRIWVGTYVGTCNALSNSILSLRRHL